jgi:hypothetical protein
VAVVAAAPTPAWTLSTARVLPPVQGSPTAGWAAVADAGVAHACTAAAAAVARALGPDWVLCRCVFRPSPAGAVELCGLDGGGASVAGTDTDAALLRACTLAGLTPAALLEDLLVAALRQRAAAM